MTNARSFEDLSVSLFGKVTGFLVEASIIVFCFGTCIAYTVAVGDIVDPFLSSTTPTWLTRKLVMVLFWAALMLPLSFVDKMSSLQCTSLFGILALAYLVLAVTIHFIVDASLQPDKVSRRRDSRGCPSRCGRVHAPSIVLRSRARKLTPSAVFRPSRR